MNAAERRTQITHLLAGADKPISATVLAAQCGVSRQIIVGDIALLRAGGLAVLATPSAVSSAAIWTTACWKNCIPWLTWAAH